MSIVVFGDLILDKYVYVDVDRVSPEAPCLIGLHKNHSSSLGGAANVGANIASAVPDVVVCGPGSHELRCVMDVKGCRNRVFLHDSPVKTRFVDKKSGIQLFRYDEEKVVWLFDEDLAYVKYAQNIIGDANPDVLVVVDYQKGAVCKTDRPWIGLSQVVVVSSKSRTPGELIRKSGSVNIRLLQTFILVVNEYEFDRLLDTSGFSYIVRTEGEHGISLFTCNRGLDGVTCGSDRSYHVDGHKVDMFDVTGAGDTVTAMFASYLHMYGHSELMIKSACRFANKAASIAVSRRGTTVITPEDVQLCLKEME